MTDLPPGWEWSTLGEVVGGAVFTDGDWVETKDQDARGDVRLVQLADVGVGHFRDRSDRRMTAAAAERLNCTYLEQGDVLVARMPEPLGRACRVPPLPTPAVTVVDVCILRPRHVVGGWLMWCLNSPQVRAQVSALQSGSTRKRISRKNLSTVRLATPPVGEQRRMAAAIEEHLAQVEVAERAVASAVAHIDQLRASLLAELTAGPWESKPLGDVLLSLRNGCFVSRPSARPPGLPIFRISAVRSLQLDSRDVRFAPDSVGHVEEYRVASGDLLFTRYSGNPDFVGACAVVPREGAGILHPDKLIRGIPKADLVDAQWIAMAMASGRGRSHVEQRLKTTAGQVGISGAQLKTVPIPVPPLPVQKARVARWDAAFASVKRLAADLDVAMGRAATLRRSILDAAFSGKLVPQDPADEPASVLLERIRAERDAAGPRRRARS